MDTSIAVLYFDAWESITHAPQNNDSESEYGYQSGPQRVINGTAALSDDPFVALEAFQDAWRSKDHETPWSTERFRDLDIGELEWQKYGPPASLYKAPSFSSQILLDLIPTSIANVQRRIVDEARRSQAESQRRAKEASASRDKGKQPLRPQDEPHDEPGESSAMAMTMSTSGRQGAKSESESPTSVVAQGKVKKRRKFSIHNLLHRSQGEYIQGNLASGLAYGTVRQKVGKILTSFHLSPADDKVVELKTRSFWAASGNDVEVECVSCLDDFTSKETVRVPCRHNYCRECFVRLISAAIQNEQQWPPKCCLNIVPFKTVVKNVPEDVKRRFHERSSEWRIPVNERIYCHEPGCGVWVKPGKIDLARRQGRCEQNHVTCTVCRGQAHGNLDCPQDRDLDMTNQLAQEEGWKRCYACRALVEHKEACQHMTCRCGAEFCYVCGLVWQTCRCTMQDLDAIKQAADERRYQRQFREQTEAHELQQILAQIEEFERLELLRAEAERLERQRIEEERWQRELMERTREELKRRKEVEAKYEQLCVLLDELHELQQVMTDSKQEDEARSTEREAEAARNQLQQVHEASRASLKMQQETETMEKEKEVAKQLAIRTFVEKHLEEDYQTDLEHFWANKPNGKEVIEIAMLRLRQRMDKSYLVWDAWGKEQLGSHRVELEEQRSAQEDEMEAAMRHLEDQHGEEGKERARRALAEKKWVQEVILERERLLKGMEWEEMEGDADNLFSGAQEWPLTS